MPCPSLFISRPLAMVPTEADNSVRHTHSRDSECECRQVVSVSPGILRLEALPSSVPSPSEQDNKWGPVDIDLFASHLTNQLPRFVSWKPDPLSEAVDAFSLQWNKVKCYAFPPFCLLGRCHSQVLRQQVPRLVLVAPVWKTQPWYPLLLDLLIDLPVLLPQIPNLVTREGMTHPLTHLQLGGWLISGSSMKREAFLSKLETCSQQLGGETPQINIRLDGASGLAGVLRRKSILVQFSDIINFLAGEFQHGKQYRFLTFTVLLFHDTPSHRLTQGRRTSHDLSIT